MLVVFFADCLLSASPCARYITCTLQELWILPILLYTIGWNRGTERLSYFIEVTEPGNRTVRISQTRVLCFSMLNQTFWDLAMCPKPASQGEYILHKGWGHRNCFHLKSQGSRFWSWVTFILTGLYLTQSCLPLLVWGLHKVLSHYPSTPSRLQK